MANRPATITATEIKRTVQAVLAAGLPFGKVVVDHLSGQVTVYPAGDSGASMVGPDPDELLKK